MLKFGDHEGLRDRLNGWAERLGIDKTLPWSGLGLIADLRAAVEVLDGKPQAPKIEEYDL